MENHNPLIGKWQLLTMTFDSGKVDFTKKELQEDRGVFASFLNDSTYILYTPGHQDTLVYNFSEDSIRFHHDLYKYSYTIKGDSLFLKSRYSKDAVTYKRVEL